MAPLLSVRDLKTQFATPEGTVQAVNGVSFEVSAGETLGIVGESGSGKSVTMLSILGLIASPPGRVTGGTANFDGVDLLKLPERSLRDIRGRRIGLVFQDPMTALNPVLTVGRQLTEGLRRHLNLDRNAATQRAIAWLDRVGIPSGAERLGQYPHQFSGGMRQRLAIAMALACEPDLLIADEPTTALDVTVQAQIVELVQQLQRDLGMATLWITHDLALLAGLADRVVVMYAGQVVEVARRDDLYRAPRHPYTIGLLNSLPRLDRPRDRLIAIPGFPPDLIAYPKGCPFAERCPVARDRCHQERPPLETKSDCPGHSHQAACWLPVEALPTLGEPRDRAA
jgi:oligopeptide transport system ATP-binding protein